MSESKPTVIEMYYTLTCPNCRTFQRMLDEVLPGFGDRFIFKKTLASSPVGYIKSLKLGIHSVPTVLVDSQIAFRNVPSRNELIEKLNHYINK